MFLRCENLHQIKHFDGNKKLFLKKIIPKKKTGAMKAHFFKFQNKIIWHEPDKPPPPPRCSALPVVRDVRAGNGGKSGSRSGSKRRVFCTNRNKRFSVFLKPHVPPPGPPSLNLNPRCGAVCLPPDFLTRRECCGRRFPLRADQQQDLQLVEGFYLHLQKCSSGASRRRLVTDLYKNRRGKTAEELKHVT